jgi:hypothetical protein
LSVETGPGGRGVGIKSYNAELILDAYEARDFAKSTRKRMDNLNYRAKTVD